MSKKLDDKPLVSENQLASENQVADEEIPNPQNDHF